jgi:hypothetical protein
LVLKISKLLGYGDSFAVGKFGDEAGWARFAAHAAFDIVGRWNDVEIVACLGEQLAAARGATGKHEACGLGAGTWRLEAGDYGRGTRNWGGFVKTVHHCTIAPRLSKALL